jgi:hypothetical protein
MNSTNGTDLEMDERHRVTMMVSIPETLVQHALEEAKATHMGFSAFLVRALGNALTTKSVRPTRPDEKIDVLGLALERAAAKSPGDKFTAHGLLSSKEWVHVEQPSQFGKRIRASLESGKIAEFKGRNHQNMAIYVRL